MERNKILLTAFCGTSAELSVKGIESGLLYQVLYLPNDKVKDAELLIEKLKQEHYDFVISLGQRPNIKDKVHIETTARKGERSIETTFVCETLKLAFEQNGLEAKLSHNAGTSFCNELYWNGLRYIEEEKLDTKMVFVHVPFKKNITDMEKFRGKMFSGLAWLETEKY